MRRPYRKYVTMLTRNENIRAKKRRVMKILDRARVHLVRVCSHFSFFSYFPVIFLGSPKYFQAIVKKTWEAASEIYLF